MTPHLCPNCVGTKIVSRPPYIAGDIKTWGATDIRTYPCPTCGGGGIIWEDTETISIDVKDDK